MMDGLKTVAVLCILRSGDEVLLLRRTKVLHYGKYVPLGGKVDPHESAREAALREVYEEAGHRLEALTFCGVLQETAPNDFNWISYVYASDVERFEPPACEEGVLEWVPLRGIADLPTYDADRFIYRYYLAGRPFVFDARYDADLNLLALEEELGGERLLG
ncbi:MAG TPA: NUDIX domain-containing protein [Chloroflexi bacterium]|nr:NUDIX domain-containing protein [Chloroflexota bacterium]